MHLIRSIKLFFHVINENLIFLMPISKLNRTFINMTSNHQLIHTF